MKLKPGINDLKTLRPDLAAEWDYESNHPLRPEHFTKGSNEEVYWICPVYHLRYKAPICRRAYRAAGSSPYTCGILPVPGVTDLASKYPLIAAEWDYEGNYPYRPEDFTYGSNTEVMWKCPKYGLSYALSIKQRTLQHYGSPYISGKLPVPGVTDLESQYPLIAAEWDYDANYPLEPGDFTCGSHDMVSWICPKYGLSYPATIASRVYGGRGSPYITGRKVVPNVTDLKTLYPEIAAEWDYEMNYPYRPEDFTHGSVAKVFWECPKCGQRFPAKINNRVANKSGCPFCAGKLPIPGKTDLASQRPDLAGEWDYDNNWDKDHINKLYPDEFTLYSNERVSWVCPDCKKTYKARIEARVVYGTGCTHCAKKRKRSRKR